MAFKISFFRTPQHRVFNYKPVYWDPKKEEFETRVKQAREKYSVKKTSEDAPYVPGSLIRGSFRKRPELKRGYPARQTMIRIVVILLLAALLVAIFYLSNAFGYLFKIF